MIVDLLLKVALNATFRSKSIVLTKNFKRQGRGTKSSAPLPHFIYFIIFAFDFLISAG